MPELTTTRLPYTDYFLIIRKARNSKCKGSGKIVIANYTTSNHSMKSGRVPTIAVGNMRLS